MKNRTCYALFFLILASEVVAAQSAIGTPRFNSFGGGPFDVVNLGNLNVHFTIPVVKKAGRGMSFSYNLAYDSSIWQPVTTGNVTSWTNMTDTNWGWTTSVPRGGHVSQSLISDVDTFCTIGRVQYPVETWTYGNWVYYDGFGTRHPFFGRSFIKQSQCGNSSGGFAGTATDGSGYQITVNGLTINSLTARDGSKINPLTGSVALTDANGNEITSGTSSGVTTYTDTLGTTAMVVSGSGTAASPYTFTYPAPGSTATNCNPITDCASYTMNFTLFTVATNFQISGILEYGPQAVPLVSSIQLPDGSQYLFSYEGGPSGCVLKSGTTSCVTGRILTVSLPTGGVITYGYTGNPHNTGIFSDGSTVALTRSLNATTTAPAETWSYSRALQTGTPGPGSTWTTTVTDPASNITVINFSEDTKTNTASTAATYALFETQRQIYQGGQSTFNCSTTHPNNCLLLTTTNCYNTSYSGCSTATVSSPITQTDSYALPAGGTSRLSEVKYNTFGLVTDDREYDYGVVTGSAPGTTKLVQETSTSYASLGNGIVNKPSSIVVYDWSGGSAVQIAGSSFNYDQPPTLTPTHNTPQQNTSISGSRGNLTTITMSTSASTSLSKTLTYYDTGNVDVATDVNGAQTTFSYGTGSCGNSFPLQIAEPLSLSRSIAYDSNCTGGVSVQVQDENTNTINTSYTDPDFWRPDSVTDQMGSLTKVKYFLGPSAVESSLQNLNSGNSASDFRTTLDGFGRPIFSQRQQSPMVGSNYDTTETDYNSVGQVYQSSMPYSAAASPGSENTTIAKTTTTYDALGRVLETIDQNGGYVTYQYANNDVLQTVSGTVSGTQSFQKQFEYDGLGRLSSVCEVSSTLLGYGTCTQSTNQNGYWTKYAYDALGHLLTVTQNAQATLSTSRQSRSFTYDWLGRMLTETNPETGHNGVSGTAHYTYDVACTTTPASPGDLTTRMDAAGNKTCFSYDALHRLTAGGYSTVCRRLHYDMSVTPPTGSGITVVNTNTRLVEASTDNCSSTQYTDEWFSYDKDGRLTDLYESAPNSSGYYHSSAVYWSTGLVKTVSLLNSSGSSLIPTQSYGLDAEGRPNAVTANSGQNPVTGVSYSTSSTTNPLGALLGVTFGSGDSDAFTYDPNTGRMGTYTFAVNGKNDKGTLTWGANGKLTKLVISDQIPTTSDSQTCTYGYDDVQRISNVTCGILWVQNFTYDAFGNITKNVPSGDGGLTFLPTYWTSPPTNQFSAFTSNPQPSYDANGKLLTDNLNTYTWDPNWGTMTTVTPSGGSAVTSTYDALGRMVENNAGGSYTEFVYGPTGRIAKCSGQTLVKAFVSLPGGAKAIYNSSGLVYYRHSDWLGSSRVTSTATRTLYSSSAYAPFGEQYATAGTTDASYTGQDQDTVSNLYDFPARRQSPSQGRWISPDPAGRGAVILTNPQSWNRYAYALNNPLSLIDAMGLSVKKHRPRAMDDDECEDDCGGDGGGDGGDGGGGGDGGSQPSDPTDGNQPCDSDPNIPCYDAGNDPGQTCDTDCQSQQALQNALMAMLTNSNCAALIGGPSSAGQAAAIGAIAGQLFGNPNPNIHFDPSPDPGITGFAETDQVNYPTPGVTIGLSPNFYDPSYTAQNGLASLSFAQNQEVTILHEFGHAMGDLNAGQYGYGITTNIMSPDNPLTNPGVSAQNDQNVDGSCLQGGNVSTQTSEVDGSIQ